MQALFTNQRNRRIMKPWIKRSLIGLLGASALFGGLAAWAHNHWQHHGWHAMTEQDATAMRERVISKVAARLDLDAAQKAKLTPLADALRDQRQALLGTAPTAHPRTQVEPLIAGNTFDRVAAQRLLSSKVEAVNTKAPAVVTAFGDFYDSLRPEQQAKLRGYLNRGQQHGRRG